LTGAGPEARFATFVAEGKFMKSTGAYVFYPRAIAPSTGAADLEWVEASGNVVVYATTCNDSIGGHSEILRKPRSQDTTGLQVLATALGRHRG
jgi:uncharacterized OB-fold protein